MSDHTTSVDDAEDTRGLDYDDYDGGLHLTELPHTPEWDAVRDRTSTDTSRSSR
jgi:hypothetical protein